MPLFSISNKPSPMLASLHLSELPDQPFSDSQQDIKNLHRGHLFYSRMAQNKSYKPKAPALYCAHCLMTTYFSTLAKLPSTSPLPNGKHFRLSHDHRNLLDKD